MEVISELASELDLHYEDDEIVVCGPTIMKMERLATMMMTIGHKLPDEYFHIIRRYNGSIH